MLQGTEDIAREQIDSMLVSAGWADQDAEKVSLYEKQGVAVREFELKSGFDTTDDLFWLKDAPGKRPTNSRSLGHPWENL